MSIRGSRTSTRLVWVLLPLALVLVFGLPFLYSLLNQAKVLGYPLGFFMAAQGTLILLALMGFWFCRRQDRLERAAERDPA